MGYTEIVQQVRKLKRREQLALLKIIADSLNEPATKQKTGRSQETGEGKELHFTRGALRQAGVPLLNDAEIQEELILSLFEKHLK